MQWLHIVHQQPECNMMLKKGGGACSFRMEASPMSHMPPPCSPDPVWADILMPSSPVPFPSPLEGHDQGGPLTIQGPGPADGVVQRVPALPPVASAVLSRP